MKTGMTGSGRDVHHLYELKSLYFDRVSYEAACGVNNNRGGSWRSVEADVTCKRCLANLDRRATALARAKLLAS